MWPQMSWPRAVTADPVGDIADEGGCRFTAFARPMWAL
jgi:hypothetical protein